MRRAALALILLAGLAFADNCPKCRKEVDKGWKFCPGCGETLPDKEREVRVAEENAAREKAEMLESLEKLRKACLESGDAERAKRLGEEIDRLEGWSVVGSTGAPGAGAEAYAGAGAGRYKSRSEFRVPAAKKAGATAESEAAVEAGLKWLARHQAPMGGWSSAGFSRRCKETECKGAGYEEYDSGVTAMALLAFLGAGYTPRSETSWVDDMTGRKVVAGEVVRRGIEWLIAAQDTEGCVGGRHGSKYLYNHAIATLALAEAYGMTGAARLKAPTQKAVDFLLAAQNPGKGWRYSKQCGDNDTSVTCWVVAALRAAEEGGLLVGRTGFDGALAWFTEVTDEAYFKVGYTAKGTGKVVVQGKNEEFDDHPCMSAAAMAARLRIDRGDKSPALEGGAKLLVTDLPIGRGPKIDVYYWYLGSEALFLWAGPESKYWKPWNEAMLAAVVQNQRGEKDGCAEGSWDASSDRWGFEGGRVYTTALSVMTLETGYRDAVWTEAPADKKPPKKK
ncbi:MAG: zinc-ribbon domain-containing protein [Planctomycetes bacterium]|nr:zinc-ribbon domain-containing protein [Planctomycetota bacterium]